MVAMAGMSGEQHEATQYAQSDRYSDTNDAWSAFTAWQQVLREASPTGTQAVPWALPLAMPRLDLVVL